MTQASMRHEIPVRHGDPGREHIEIRRDGEDCSEKPQMPRHARAVEEGRNGAGRDDVGWGRSHQSFLYRMTELLTNARRRLSGDHDGTLIVP